MIQISASISCAIATTHSGEFTTCLKDDRCETYADGDPSEDACKWRSVKAKQEGKMMMNVEGRKGG